MKRIFTLLSLMLLLYSSLSQGMRANPLDKGGLYDSFKNIALPLDANNVNTLFQDWQGMMWFGTKRGLFCYNGYDIHEFANETNTDANYIHAIAQISPEELYIGSNLGLTRFNLFTEQYEPTPTELQKIGAVRSLSLFDGKLWIGTMDEGLYCYDPTYEELKEIQLEGKDGTMVIALEPADDKIFIGSYETLSCYDPLRHNRVLIKYNGSDHLMVNSLLWDADNECVWVGTDTDLLKYSITEESLSVVPELSGNFINVLALDSQKNLLAGTDAGFYVYNPNSRKLNHITHDSRNNRSLCNNIIRDIRTDQKQNVWFATDHGVSLAHPDSGQRFIHLSELVQSNEGNIFTCIYAGDGGELWLGGENGLIHLEEKNNEVRADWFSTNNKSHPLRHNHIRNVYEDRDKNIWLATDGSIAMYDRGTSQFIYYTLQEPDGHKNANWSYDIYEDGEGRLWVATYFGGLFVLEKQKLLSSKAGTPFTDFIHRIDAELGSSVYQMFPDGKGNMWADSQKGLARIDMKTFEVELKEIYLDNMILSGDSIYYSSEGSLFSYDISGNEPYRLPFNANGGRIHTFVGANGDIWLSASTGIFRIDARSGKIECVSTFVSDSQAGYYHKEANEVLWGGNDGLTCFPLVRAAGDRCSESVFITGISADGMHLSPNLNYKGHSPRFNDSFKLKYRKNIVLELSSYEYSIPGNESFHYQINKEDSWHRLERGQNHISFAVINPGVYKINLCGTNPEEDENAIITSYIMTIPHPWYGSKLAFCIYGLAILLTILSIIRRVQRKNKEKYEQREKERTLELANLKMDFFVNISHELKTPLSLIVGPLSKLISETGIERDKHALQSIQRNALRLNALIQKVLDFKQIEYESEDILIRSRVELCSLLRNCIANFTNSAGEKNISLNFKSEVDALWLNLDVLKIESVFINLISNALKYTPEGTGVVNVSLHRLEDKVCVTVSDNGSGIQEDELPLVFVRFFQGKGKKKGSGIGLYLVKKFIELHNGSIELKNNDGLTVLVTFPTGGENAIPTDTNIKEIPSQHEEDDLKTILIIDDNVEMVTFLSEALSPQYHCVCAYNGKEGIYAVKERVPDLIIVDQMMPEMDGFEFTRNIRHGYSTVSIPIIMLTAKDDIDAELKSIKVGIDVFISKPFDLKKLILRVAQLLQKKESLEQAIRIESISQPIFNKDEKPTADELLMEKVSKAIEENMENEDFSVVALAEAVAVDSKQLYRKIKQMTGLSPVNYMRKLRMKKASVLLAQNKFTISEVIYMVGYTNASYFTKCFTEEFGVTPKQFATNNKPYTSD